MIPLIAVADRLIKDIKEDNLTAKEIQDRVHTLANKALAQAESEDSNEIYNRLKDLTDILKENYNFATRDTFITQAIDKVIQTCNTLSSKNQLAPSLPAEALFTVIDHLPFSTKSDVEKVVAILKEMEPKGKPPPDVKSYHKHLMESFIIKVNESAVPLKYFYTATLEWLVPKLSHLNLLGLEAGKFLNTYLPTNAKTYSISATELEKLYKERQKDIVLKITHFDLKEIPADRFNEMLQQAINAKTYSINASDLASFSVEEMREIAPKITDLKISDTDLSNEQLTSLMENCINLCHLKIKTNATSFPDSWPFIKQLETLDCSYCRDLIKLPNNMTQIRELHCNCCRGLEKLPDKMPQLEELNCIGCSIERLPDHMPQIRKLSCGGCRNLKKLPDSMPLLEKLYFSNTLIESLPDKMQALWALNCSWCYIRSLPENMPQLRELNCNGCRNLKKLPDNMPKLVVLGCRDCYIRSLPENMPYLRVLDCNGCRRLSIINVPSGCAVKR